jgi:hypothetical protein
LRVVQSSFGTANGRGGTVVLPVNMNTGMARHAKAAGLIVVGLLIFGILVELL